MTRQQKAFINKWRKLLRVRDWHIDIKEKDKFKVEGQTGSTLNNINFRHSKIRLKKKLSKKEFELTVIHELLHVVFAGFIFEEGTAANLELERGIEGLARLLRGLDGRRR